MHRPVRMWFIFYLEYATKLITEDKNINMQPTESGHTSEIWQSLMEGESDVKKENIFTWAVLFLTSTDTNIQHTQPSVPANWAP